jgi:hypothetical protein
VQVGAADALERAGLVDRRADAGGDLEGLLVMRTGARRPGRPEQQLPQVAEGLRLPEAVTEVAVQLQRAPQVPGRLLPPPRR